MSIPASEFLYFRNAKNLQKFNLYLEEYVTGQARGKIGRTLRARQWAVRSQQVMSV